MWASSPDRITGQKINGVQMVALKDRLRSYDGEVFHRPIIGPRTMTQHQAIYDFIDQYHGTPYEKHTLQLARAELDIFPWQKNKPDASSLFCSETVVMCFHDAGLIEDDGTPANEFTPTDCSNDVINLVNGLRFGAITTL